MAHLITKTLPEEKGKENPGYRYYECSECGAVNDWNSYTCQKCKVVFDK